MIVITTAQKQRVYTTTAAMLTGEGGGDANDNDRAVVLK